MLAWHIAEQEPRSDAAPIGSVMIPAAAARAPTAVMDGIAERHEQGLLVLSPSHGRASRRVLFVNCYGGKSLLEKIKSGNTPPHHLWGCLELARMGYEVAIAEPVTDFYFSRNPFPHDLRLLRFTQAWLGRDGIIYCGHNVLYWLPFLRKLGAVRCPIVSLLYGREPLNFSRVHSGIIALNGAAADHARKLAPRTKVARLSWGGDLDYFPRLPYAPRWFLSCGITNRDFPTLCRAASKSKQPIRVICPGLPEHLVWPANVEIIDGGRGWNVDEKKISYRQLLHDHYAQNAGSLIILDEDTREYTGCGFTNLIEAMAMSRPVIITRTGALPTEIDVERAGCGLFVRPGDADALAGAIEALGREPARAALMGQKGRQLAEEHYNIQRYARDLHTFFESL